MQNPLLGGALPPAEMFDPVTGLPKTAAEYYGTDANGYVTKVGGPGGVTYSANGMPTTPFGQLLSQAQAPAGPAPQVSPQEQTPAAPPVPALTPTTSGADYKDIAFKAVQGINRMPYVFSDYANVPMGSEAMMEKFYPKALQKPLPAFAPENPLLAAPEKKSNWMNKLLFGIFS